MSGNWWDKPHVLYRLFDEAGALLYVGISADFETRMRLHLSTTSRLYSRVTGWEGTHARYHHHTTEPYPSKEAAHAAEVAAIAAERPELNFQHNPARPPHRVGVTA